MDIRTQMRVSGLERRELDRYFTPVGLVAPLIKHLPAGTRFYEPCAGDGGIIHHLALHEVPCVGASDIAPLGDFIRQRDLFDISEEHLCSVDVFISNLPYGDPGNPRSRKQMHAMIDHLRKLRPTWLLLPIDWCVTVQAIPYMTYASDIVSVRRWRDPGTPSGGYFNFCWVRFQSWRPDVTVFHAR